MELLERALVELEKLHGRPKRAIPKTPLDWILWENVAYLVDDRKRELAFRALTKHVGRTAGAIAAASDEALRAATDLGGMHPAERVERLRGIARLALAEGSQDLAEILRLPRPAAKRILKRFPSIGDPGAEKILLYCGAGAALALESNGLRVAVRLGYGAEKKSYAATYRAALEALAPATKGKARAWLVRAHELLRAHGRTLCKRSAPDCDACPLAARCRFAARAG